MLKERSEIGRGLAALALVCAVLALSPAAATAQEEEISWVAGPTTVDLGDVARVELPEGYLFADGDATQRIMQAMGNPPSGQEKGLIAPAAEDKNWFVVFEYDPVGYVTDDDQDEIDADALFKSISDATEASNEVRAEMGASALHVRAWAESPHYDPGTNNLVWALEAANDAGNEVVNYNVRLLGRHGYMSVTLVTDLAMLTQDKPEIEAVLAGFSYEEGKRYGDYVSGDKLAGYGLAALVAGGAGAAAAKLGLFAVLGKFLAKAWKLLVVGAIAVGSFLKRIFGGRRASTEGAG